MIIQGYSKYGNMDMISRKSQSHIYLLRTFSSSLSLSVISPSLTTHPTIHHRLIESSMKDKFPNTSISQELRMCIYMALNHVFLTQKCIDGMKRLEKVEADTRSLILMKEVPPTLYVDRVIEALNPDAKPFTRLL